MGVKAFLKVMAKYLVDSNARLDESWLQLAEEVVKGTPQEARRVCFSMVHDGTLFGARLHEKPRLLEVFPV